MKKFHDLILRNINGAKVLAFFVMTNVLYVFMLTVTIPSLMQYSNGMKPLDMMPTGYSLDYVNTLFEQLGEKGRDLYLFTQIPVDMVYPLLFGVSYCLLLAFFLNKLNRLTTFTIFLCAIPLVAGLFDYLENFGIIVMLHAYPQLLTGQVLATNVFSIVKSTASTIYFAILIVVLLMNGYRFLRRKTASPAFKYHR